MMRKSKFGGFYVTLVLVLLYLPIAVVVAYSFNESKYGNWTGFTLSWYEKLFTNATLMECLMNSLQVAVLSCAAAAIIGTMGAIGLARSAFRGKGMLENLAIMPMMIPEIILGMAYLAFFTFANLQFGMFTLVAAHTTFCIPYILINVQSRLVGIDPAYVEAARDLGATPTKAFTSITLPLIMPAVLSGTLLAFAMSMDDVVISFFVPGTRTNTLPLKIYSMIKTGITPDINALCTLMLGVVAIVLALAMLLRKKKSM